MAEIRNLGVTPICPTCGYVMRYDYEKGSDFVIVQCGIPSCKAYEVKYRITLPVLLGEKVDG